MPTTLAPFAAPTAEDVLKRMAEFYQAANSIQATVEHEMQLQGPGMDTHMTSTSKFAAEKPNRFAIRSDNGATAIDVVTDGKTMFTYIPAMNSYSESEAPQSFDELIANPVGMLMGGGMGGSFLVSLLISDPYKSIMEGVTSTEYLGTTTLADASVHHVKATQDQFDWEAWIATGETPLLHRISINMSKAAKQFAGGGAETKMTTNVNFRTGESTRLSHRNLSCLWLPKTPRNLTICSEASAAAQKKPHRCWEKRRRT